MRGASELLIKNANGIPPIILWWWMQNTKNNVARKNIRGKKACYLSLIQITRISTNKQSLFHLLSFPLFSPPPVVLPFPNMPASPTTTTTAANVPNLKKHEDVEAIQRQYDLLCAELK